MKRRACPGISVPSLVVACLLGCGAPPPAPPEPAPTTSYLRDIQPLVERSCLSCHVEGGPSPFSLQTPDAARKMGTAMLRAVESGRMPPFYASAGCNSYRDDGRFSPGEVALLERWVEEGSPLGDPAEERHAAASATLTEVRHDLDLDIEPFDVRVMDGDDNYRCFSLDPGQASDVMVTGYEVTPGNRQVVHHVLAYLVEPAQVATLRALDDADPGPGYRCQSGRVGIDGTITQQLAGWVPGAQPTRLPEGSGLLLTGGGRVVMQVHYNLNGLSRAEAVIDRTRLSFELAPVSSVTRARIFPVLKRNLDIKAYDAMSVQSVEVPASLFSGAVIYRLAGHMHLLGTRVKLEAVHTEGSPTCLLDVPDWDFNWQREYALVTPYTVRSGDRLRLTCVYDNSPENQPLVAGARTLPRDVAWGEGSLDEMCMTYLTFLP